MILEGELKSIIASHFIDLTYNLYAEASLRFLLLPRVSQAMSDLRTGNEQTGHSGAET